MEIKVRFGKLFNTVAKLQFLIPSSVVSKTLNEINASVSEINEPDVSFDLLKTEIQRWKNK